jgi:hypothetical protein
MSHNGPYTGPPWSGGSSDEPYTEPADPWGDQASAGSEPSWVPPSPAIPQQPVSYHSAPVGTDSRWTPPPSRPRRNTPVLALVVVLGLLIATGVGAAAWLFKERHDRAGQEPQTAVSSTADAGTPPLNGEDARFDVKAGDCVVNEGTDEKPDMRKNVCTSGTYQVLKRINGKTTGEKDAEGKCSKVRGYTKWYFYDSPLDDLDFVLCLKERKAV